MAIVMLTVSGYAFPAAGQGASAARADSAAMLTAVYIYDGNAGIPPGKIMLGVAFYGHRWITTYAAPLYQPAAKKDTLSYAAISKLITKTPDAVKYDNEAQAPYFLNDKVFISYADERSIAQKGAYAKDRGLMGLFAWEYGSESTGTLVDAMR